MGNLCLKNGGENVTQENKEKTEELVWEGNWAATEGIITKEMLDTAQIQGDVAGGDI